MNIIYVKRIIKVLSIRLNVLHTGFLSVMLEVGNVELSHAAILQNAADFVVVVAVPGCMFNSLQLEFVLSL